MNLHSDLHENSTSAKNYEKYLENNKLHIKLQ